MANEVSFKLLTGVPVSVFLLYCLIANGYYYSPNKTVSKNQLKTIPNLRELSFYNFNEEVWENSTNELNPVKERHDDDKDGVGTNVEDIIADIRNYTAFVQNNCKKYAEKYVISTDRLHLLYSNYRQKREKFIFFPVPKCGWSSWNYIMFEDAHKKSVFEAYRKSGRPGAWDIPYSKVGWKTIPSIPELKAIRSRPNKPESLIFVRHPLLRLVSAYRDKVLHHGYNHCPRPPKNVVHNFVDYAQCVIDTVKLTGQPPSSFEAGKSLEMHTQPQGFYGKHCKVNYSLMTPFESYSRSLPAIFKYLNIEAELQHQNPSSHLTEKTSGELLRTLSQHQLDMLYEIYSVDFDLFGFSKSIDGIL